MNNRERERLEAEYKWLLWKRAEVERKIRVLRGLSWHVCRDSGREDRYARPAVRAA